MEQHREDRNILEQEERSNVMKMNKLYAGLIAFAMGFALSVGTASAQETESTVLAVATEMRGQVSGDPRAMKLVPFYEVGENRFTAIGIQNLSKGMADETATKDADGDPTNNLTERFLVDVTVYDERGTNMEAAAGTVCLEADAFGSVTLMMGMDEEPMVMGSNTSMVTIYLPDMSMGYAELTMDTTNRYKDCGGRLPITDTAGGDPDATPPDDNNVKGEEKIATWAILQDIGTGFFGTEIPTASIRRNPNADRSMMHLACRSVTGDAEANGAPAGIFNTAGPFNSMRCGLIPDEFDKDSVVSATSPRTASDPLTMVAARFDITESNGSMSDIFIWLDTALVKDPNSRLDIGTYIAATVYCEDGEDQLAPDGGDAGEELDLLLIQTNNKVTIIDPADHPMVNGNLGDFTSKCMDEDGMGGRGVLRFNMPEGSLGGMVWTHISQMDSHYRMNFLAHSIAAGDDDS